MIIMKFELVTGFPKKDHRLTPFIYRYCKDLFNWNMDV